MLFREMSAIPANIPFTTKTKTKSLQIPFPSGQLSGGGVKSNLPTGKHDWQESTTANQPDWLQCIADWCKRCYVNVHPLPRLLCQAIQCLYLNLCELRAALSATYLTTNLWQFDK